MTAKTYEQKLAAWKKAKFAPPPEPDLTPAQPAITTMATMRDGVKLYTEVYLPKTGGQNTSWPIVLMRSPYPYNRPSRNDKLPISRYLEAGFGLVFQLCRGQGQSEGVFHFMRDDVEDGFDCVNWVAEQSWCDGNVGMQGASYVGHTQLYAARLKPKALKCIMPTAFIGNFINNFPYHNGVPMRGSYMQWNTVADAESLAELDMPYGDMSVLKHDVWGPALRHRPLLDAANGMLSGDKLASWRDTLAHPYDDDWWAPVHFTDEQLADLDIPMFFTDGWYDMTVGPIDYFSRLEAMNAPGERYLLVGPWNHAQTYAQRLQKEANGERSMPENAPLDMVAQRLAFFERYLKGNKDVAIQPDKVQIYITGVNEWRCYPTFPVPGTATQTLYLHSEGTARHFPDGGQLDDKVAGDESPDQYIYDPAVPPLFEPERFTDCRELEIRSDVLTYTTQPLVEPLTILGEIKLELHAATDGRDTDWFAMVTEVFPDGRSLPFHATLGVLRGRYHKGLDKEALLTPNEPTLFHLNLGPAGHQLAVGNHLRLSIFSAAFPTWDANTNTGEPVATDREHRVAKQTIYHDVKRPSRLLLPVISG